MNIGLLRETRSPVDSRVALAPQQCRLIEDEFPGTRLFVQPGNKRCFTDSAYENEGIAVRNDLSACDVLFGVKEVAPHELLHGKTYFFFSHTKKKQEHNKRLLQTVLDRHVRLIDYEALTDSNGIRIIGFGRWAGLIGAYSGIRALCIRQNLLGLPPPEECRGLEELRQHAAAIQLPPVSIAVTGDGRVAGGAEEMLNAFGIKKVTVDDYLNRRVGDSPNYVQLDPEKYNIHFSGRSFELPHFFASPGEYKSNFLRFCNRTDLLVMAAYWDPHAPVLFTAKQMTEKNFAIRVIADITCDLNGSVPTTLKTTSFKNPYYDYNPVSGTIEKAFTDAGNITVMAIDNLPSGLPAESSTDFGNMLIKNVLPLLLGPDSEGIITRGTIAEAGKLTGRFSYLSDWVNA